MNPFKEMVKPLTWGSYGSSLSHLCAKLPVKPLPAARSLTATPFGASRGTGFWPGPAVQAALTVGPADDEYEREADRMADQVMRMPEPEAQRSCRSCNEEETVQRASLAARITPLVERQAATEEEELQTKPLAGQVQRAGANGGPAGLELEQSLARARGGGSPLGEEVKGRMENAFGFDFSSVRIHSDARADSLSRSIQARAFTRGQDIFLRQGEYQPASARGQRLLAHELTHVVQQNGGAVQRGQMQATGQGEFASGVTGASQTKKESSSNNTGMQDHPKSGIEDLLSMALSSECVDYSSEKPAQINALGYTQDQDIDVGAGQEWHQPIQRFLEVTGFERVDKETEIDGFIKRIAPIAKDRKIWGDLKEFLSYKFHKDTIYPNVAAFFRSLFEEGEISDEFNRRTFRAVMGDDLHHEHSARPKSLTHERETYRVNGHLARGTYAFVKKPGDSLKLGKFGHEHLAQGEDVEYAGEAVFNRGDLLFWTNKSGHYKPSALAMDRADLPVDRFVPIGFVDDEAIERAAQNTRNPRKLASLFDVSVEEIKAAFNRLGIEKMGGGSW